jgi:hypothetical protein
MSVRYRTLSHCQQNWLSEVKLNQTAFGQVVLVHLLDVDGQGYHRTG